MKVSVLTSYFQNSTFNTPESSLSFVTVGNFGIKSYLRSNFSFLRQELSSDREFFDFRVSFARACRNIRMQILRAVKIRRNFHNILSFYPTFFTTIIINLTVNIFLNSRVSPLIWFEYVRTVNYCEFARR